jgi:hypothetical protein
LATAKINSGVCGYHTTVKAQADRNYIVALQIESQCEAIQKLAENLTEVNALNEISFQGNPPETLQKGAEFCTHAACPVPSGILKAVEVAAGLALPANVSIELEK